MAIDFRFVEIDYELWALGQYLEIIERNIPHLSQSERQRILGQMTSGADFAEFDLLSQEADQIEEDVIPRHLRGSFVVVLWAVFEGAVITVAKYAQQAENFRLGLSDLRGGFSDRARKYFAYGLEFTLVQDNANWEALRALETVRHVVAHTNSRIAELDESSRARLSALSGSGIRIKEDRDFMVIEASFCRSSYDVVDLVLKDLLKRSRATFRLPG